MDWLHREREKLQPLSTRQKLAYIWDYYKLWIIGIVALVLFSGYMVSNYIHANRETHVYIMYVNTFAEIGQDSDFWQGYVDFADVDAAQENVSFDAENYFKMANANGNTYYEKAVVLMDSGTMDAIVMEPEELAQLGEHGRLIDLNNEKTRALAEKYSDRLITVPVTDDDGTAREIPVGIDISDSTLVTQQGAYESCAIGICSDAQHIDAVETFLAYILQEG